MTNVLDTATLGINTMLTKSLLYNPYFLEYIRKSLFLQTSDVRELPVLVPQSHKGQARHKRSFIRLI
jgi:hypothetical protein